MRHRGARRPTWVALALALAGCGDDGAAARETVASASSTGVATTSTAGTADTTAEVTEGPGPEGWRVVAELGPELGMAMSVWGPSSDQALVVGGQRQGSTSSGFVLRRAGDQWVPDDLPAGTPMLDWVARAGDDLWAVGLDGAALREQGGAWVAHDTGTTVTLWGVWGAAGDDLWAVGGDGVTEAPTLLHFDGATFEAAALPALPPDAHALFKVWGFDAAHVFIAGDDGVLLRRDGDGWEPSTPGSIAPFIALWGRGVDEVVAVGGRSNARIARWDGASWSDVTLEPAGLNGVWLDADGTATLVGRLGGIFELAPGSLEPVPVPPPTGQLLHAVHGFDDGSRIAVGGSFEGAPPWVGVIVEHRG